MKASQLIEILERMVDKHGDLEPAILEAESGTYERISAVLLYDNNGEKRFDLCTDRQCE